MLEEVASYIWAHSSSLIKNLTPFEHDAEICSFSVIMESICKQPDDTFIQMASPKIDFYFQVFKHSKTTFWIISQEQQSIKTLEFTETDSYFYSFTFSSSSHQWIDFLWICWQKNCGFNSKILSAWWGYKPGFCFFSSQMIKHDRLIIWTISYQTEPNPEKFSFLCLSSIGKNWKSQPRATFKTLVFNPCVNWAK